MPPHVFGSHSSAARARATNTPSSFAETLLQLAQPRLLPAPPAQRVTPPKNGVLHEISILFLRSRRCPLSHHSFEKTRRERSYAPPSIPSRHAEPAFALPPLVVSVVLPSSSLALAGFPSVCWWSLPSSVSFPVVRVCKTSSGSNPISFV
jgi:hypothetical protein